jgi:very-short-patch-repair endonuclease
MCAIGEQIKPSRSAWFPPPLWGRVRVGGKAMAHEFARHLRRNMTDAEQFAWKRIRGRQIAGFRFRRQAPIGPYIADFVCYEAKLVFELDGGQHAERVEHDAERTRWFEGEGFRVVRFWNHEVLTDWDTVEQELWRLLTDGGRLTLHPRATAL